MEHSADTNAAIWQSAEAVQAWSAEAGRQERTRATHRQFLAGLLPFGPRQAFTFLDLGAGTGAVSRTILQECPGRGGGARGRGAAEPGGVSGKPRAPRGFPRRDEASRRARDGTVRGALP